jgi:hypothetical protein
VATRSGVLRALLLALVATAVPVGAGVLRHDPETPPPVATTKPLAVRLSAIDTATAVVRRAPFSDAVPAADAATAVTDDSPTKGAWSNGDPLPVTAGTGSRSDVAHEFGCSWTAASGTVATAWVFAPPVTVARAQSLAAAARKAKGCTTVPGAPAYGAPAVALSCTTGGTTTLSYQGLFGDAWLVCRLSGSTSATAADLADRWCASVLTAAGATTAS